MYNKHIEKKSGGEEEANESLKAEIITRKLTPSFDC